MERTIYALTIGVYLYACLWLFKGLGIVAETALNVLH